LNCHTWEYQTKFGFFSVEKNNFKIVWFIIKIVLYLWKQKRITMDYKIIRSSSIDTLNERVNEMLLNGYETVGSHQVVVIKSQNRYSGTQHIDTINTIEYSQTVKKINLK
jgi:hypothetical protein